MAEDTTIDTEIVRLQFSEEELEELRKEFNIINKNREGEIDQDDSLSLLLERVFGITDVSAEQKKQVLTQLDVDQSGGVSFEEFVDSISLVSLKTLPDLQALVAKELVGGEQIEPIEPKPRELKRRASNVNKNEDAMLATLMAPTKTLPRLAPEEARLLMAKVDMPDVANLVKYSKKGKGKTHFFSITFEDKKGERSVFPCIKWRGLKGITKGDKRVYFTHVIRVQEGQNTPVFAKAGNKVNSVNERSFSLVYLDEDREERSLDLVADSEKQYNVWVEVCTRLLENSMNPDSNPAIGNCIDKGDLVAGYGSWCNPNRRPMDAYLDAGLSPTGSMPSHQRTSSKDGGSSPTSPKSPTEADD